MQKAREECRGSLGLYSHMEILRYQVGNNTVSREEI